MQRAARFTYATVALSLIGSLVVSGGSAQAATSDWTLLSPSQYPSARSQAAMTYDVATGQTLLFGGTTTTTYRSGANVADTWTWDGSNWRQLHPSVSPPPTAGAAMAYDAATRQVVLFGGSSTNLNLNALAQTWTWNGVAWTQQHPATSPPAVTGATMAFDAATNQLVLTGGSAFSNGAIVNNTQTWLWDGKNWTLAPHAIALPSSDVTMAYDPESGELVLVQEGTGLGVATLAWDGTTWNQRTTASDSGAPPARDGAVLVYSPAAQELILEGGQTLPYNYVGDVWVWADNTWTQRTDGSPYPMAMSAAATDSAGQLVLFGGLEGDFTSVQAVADTWVYRPTRGSPSGAAVARVAGTNREATAIAASQSAYPNSHSAGAVVLAREDQFADALAGGELAAAKKGPLLLTSSQTLDSPVAAEISRVLAPGGTVFVLGGPTAVSDSVASAVQGLGFTVERIAGSDRYATAAAVADLIVNPTSVFETDGTGFADALAAVPAVVQAGGVLLLTAGHAQSSATGSFVAAHPTLPRYAVGGPAAAADPGAVAIVGADRYATAAQLANAFFPNANGVAIASGVAFPDALAAGPIEGAASRPVVLAPASGSLPEPVAAYLALRDDTITNAVAYGGSSAVSDRVLAEVTTALGTP